MTGDFWQVSSFCLYIYTSNTLQLLHIYFLKIDFLSPFVTVSNKERNTRHQLLNVKRNQHVLLI